MVHDEEYVTGRECAKSHESLVEWITKIETRIDRLESKMWYIILLLVSNLVGIIVLLVKK